MFRPYIRVTIESSDGEQVRRESAVYYGDTQDEYTECYHKRPVQIADWAVSMLYHARKALIAQRLKAKAQ